MDEIRMITIGKLWPHPENPRKDLGDLTELAESIRVNGILQNLTVVPWFSALTWQPCDDPKAQKEMGYRVVIGHRRLAAAKQAGLKELPCVIRQMYHDEQVRTMLMENMQRSDLTYYEQAQGIQMMLDLGDSVEDISRKSGFSQSTIRRRVKLLELDQEKFKKSIERGATLMDYMELDKISDTDRKNEVLDFIGTKNFRQKLQCAIEQEKREAYLAQVKEFCEGFATEVTEVDRSNYQYVHNYGWWNKRALERPADADSVKYFFFVGEQQVDLYRERIEGTDAVSEEEQKKQAEREAFAKRRAALEDAETRARTLRQDFIVGFTRSKSCAVIIDRWLTWAVIYNGGALEMLLRDLLECKLDKETGKIPEDVFLEEYESRPNYVRLCAVYASLDQGQWGNLLSYIGRAWEKQRCYLIHRPSEELDRVYQFLKELGYEMSDEEQALQDGTHELFEEVPDTGT